MYRIASYFGGHKVENFVLEKYTKIFPTKISHNENFPIYGFLLLT